MKKISKYFLLLSAVVALTGCSDKKNPATVDRPKTTDIETITFSWQEAYENKIREFKESDQYSPNSAFDIFDITGDGSAELIISTNSEPTTKCLMYTYADNEIVELGEAGYCGTFKYSLENNIINDEFKGNGFVLGKILQFSAGSFNTILSYNDNSESASMGAEIVHEINGENLSLGDYEKAINPYISTPAVQVGRRFTMGDSAINYGLRYSEGWKSVLSSDQKKLCRTKLEEEMALAEESGRVACFDLCDLNGDKIPELIISENSAPESTCTIYYFSKGNLVAMDGSYGANGVINFDSDKYVFFADTEPKKYWSIANSAFSASDYHESDSIATIGRKYSVSESGISAVFG